MGVQINIGGKENDKNEKNKCQSEFQDTKW